MRAQRTRLKMSMPTARERDRYVLIRLISEEDVVYPDLEAAVWNTLLDFYGESGVSGMSLNVMRSTWNDADQACVIRCNNTSVPQLIAGLGLISRLGESRVVVKIVKVSGTMKSLVG